MMSPFSSKPSSAACSRILRSLRLPERADRPEGTEKPGRCLIQGRALSLQSLNRSPHLVILMMTLCYPT